MTSDPEPMSSGAFPFTLLVATGSVLRSDFGEAMPVLFQIPVDHRRIMAWVGVLSGKICRQISARKV